MKWCDKISLLHCFSKFSNINILQGSVVTRLRRGGVFIDCFIANFQESETVKEFWKLVFLT